MTRHALEADAQTIAARELVRRRGMLGELPGGGRAAVERVVERTAAAIAAAVLEAAREEPRLAAALESIYAVDDVNVLTATAD